jgi:DNA-binding HxlR family transcriptional regulator
VLPLVQMPLEDGPGGVAHGGGVVQLVDRAEPVGARALLDRCPGLSSSVLYDRLRDLTAAGLIVQDPSDQYRLTPSGRSLGTALDPLDAWSKRWARSRPDP